MTDFIGSSGTLIGAALETAGYYYQSHVIDAMGTPFASSMGALLYIVAALIAVVTYILMGEYKFGGWFLMGPVLFYACLFQRVETSGSDWQFGGEPRDREALEEQVISELDGVSEAYTPRISGMFANYNNLVSSVMRDIVATLNASRKNVDKKFLIRAQLFGHMVSPVLKEPGFRTLLHHGLFEHCRKVTETARLMVDPSVKGVIVKDPDNGGVEIERANLLERQYRAMLKERRIKLKRVEAEYVAILQTDYGDLFNKKVVNSVDDELKNVNSNCYTAGSSAPCIQPANNLTKTVLPQMQEKNNANKELVKEFANSSGAVNPDHKLGAGVVGVLEERSLLDAENVREIQSQLYTCTDIWNFVYTGLHRQAVRVYESNIENGMKTGLTREALESEFLKFTNQDSPSGVYRYLAKKLFKNEFIRGPVGALLYTYEDQSGPIATEVGMPPESKLAANERVRMVTKEWDARNQMMVSASSLPYYQGLALYLLSLMYPFFCFLLVIPGKHSGFLLWFVMWLWAKSWDVGFAIVMLLDDILFSLFVVEAQQSNSPIDVQLSSDLSIAVWAMQEMDPSFNLATYYKIIAVALHSIPMILSYLIVGSMVGGVGLIAAGAQRWMGSGGSGYGDVGGMSQPAMMGTSQFGIDKYRGKALRRAMQTAGKYLNNDKGGKIPAAGYLENRDSQQERLGYNSSPLSMAGSGVDTSSGFGGMSSQALSSAAVKSAAVGGFVTGLSGESASSSRNGVKRASNIVGGIGQIANSAEGAFGSILSNQLNKNVEWASYRSMNSKDSQVANGMARMYRMFEMPWTTNGGWREEWKRELNMWTEGANMIASVFGAISSGIDPIKSVSPTVNPGIWSKIKNGVFDGSGTIGGAVLGLSGVDLSGMTLDLVFGKSGAGPGPEEENEDKHIDGVDPEQREIISAKIANDLEKLGLDPNRKPTPDELRSALKKYLHKRGIVADDAEGSATFDALMEEFGY